MQFADKLDKVHILFAPAASVPLGPDPLSWDTWFQSAHSSLAWEIKPSFKIIGV